MRLATHILVASLFALGVVSGHGATLTLDTTTIPGLSPKTPLLMHTIRLSGPIDPGEANRLRKMLERLRGTTTARPASTPLATVELSSHGGDLYEGLKLGYLFREFDVATVVRKGDICLSACALAFLGGTQSHTPPPAVPSRSIEIGGQVGFHNFYLTSPGEISAASRNVQEGVAKGFSIARGGAAAMMRYGIQMGVDATYLARLMGVPPDTWEYVDTDEAFVALRICPIGLKRPPSDPAVIAANVCNHATGGLGPASSLQARWQSTRDARRHLLENVRNNAETMSVKGPLSAQLAAVMASRDDRLVEQVYDGLRSLGVPLPQLLGSTYEVTGYSFGEFALECTVSFSRDDPAKYDVVLAVQDGLMKPLQTAPAACPELFLFEGVETLNPRR